MTQTLTQSEWWKLLGRDLPREFEQPLLRARVYDEDDLEVLMLL